MTTLAEAYKPASLPRDNSPSVRSKLMIQPSGAFSRSGNTIKLHIDFTTTYMGDDNVAYIDGIASCPEGGVTGERISVAALKGREFAAEVVQRYARQLDNEMPTLVNLFIEHVNAPGAWQELVYS